MDPLDEVIRTLQRSPMEARYIHRQDGEVVAIIMTPRLFKAMHDQAKPIFKPEWAQKNRRTRKQRRERAAQRRSKEEAHPRSRTGRPKHELRSIGGRYG